MRILFCLIVCSCLLIPMSSALAEDDKSYMEMFFKEEDMVVVSPTRHPKKISYAAENISIVTAADIRLMNAHTLADVLNTINGVQPVMTGGPGSLATTRIQGSEQRHVTIFIDGVSVNSLSDNAAEIGSFPVQNIARIEIIKGPASASWGSALGGIVNIITKTGDTDKNLRGTLSASYGEKNTGDYRVEAYGKKGAFDYYFNAGKFKTDGLRPHNKFSGDNIYANFSYNLSTDTKVRFAMGYNKGASGIAEDNQNNLIFDDKSRSLFSTLSVVSQLSKEAEADLSVRTSRSIYNQFISLSGVGMELDRSSYDDRGYGASGKVSWQRSIHQVTSGFDYDYKKLVSNKIADGRQHIEKVAFYANDTMAFDKIALTPGIRFDYTDTNGNFLSPSIGLTYEPISRTILRATIARGFSIPPLAYTFGNSLFFVANPQLKVERVWSYQVGVETDGLKYVWLKIAAFRHDVSDAITVENLSPGSFQTVNGGKERREGIEVDLRSAPVYNISLYAAATFINAKNLETGEMIKNIPRYTYDLGLQYDNNSWLKALIKGRYAWLNFEGEAMGKYNGFIVDINLIGTPGKIKGNPIEVFFNVHNVLNGSQYAAVIYKNPSRWMEAGIRYSF